MTLFGSWPGFLTRRHFMSTQLCGAQGRGLFGFCFGLLLLFHLQWWTKFFWDFTNEYDELWTLMDYAGLWWIMMDYEMYKPIQRCDLHKVLKGFECAPLHPRILGPFLPVVRLEQWAGSVEKLQAKPPSSSQPSIFAVPKSSFSAPVVPQCRWRN